MTFTSQTLEPGASSVLRELDHFAPRRGQSSGVLEARASRESAVEFLRLNTHAYHQKRRLLAVSRLDKRLLTSRPNPFSDASLLKTSLRFLQPRTLNVCDSTLLAHHVSSYDLQLVASCLSNACALGLPYDAP